MNGREAILALTRALESHGMQVYQSFDLRSALATLPECGCPYHRTSQCTCQYAVLLVYSEAVPPVEVMTHGRDEWTWIVVPQTDDVTALVRERVLTLLQETFGKMTQDWAGATTVYLSATDHVPSR
jgi:hypothetical protein